VIGLTIVSACLKCAVVVDVGAVSVKLYDEVDAWEKVLAESMLGRRKMPEVKPLRPPHSVVSIEITRVQTR
jgi:hypothetical protein